MSGHRIAVASVVICLGALYAYTMVWSLKTGWAGMKGHPFRHDYNRRKDPFSYWFSVAFLAFMAAMHLGVAAFVLLKPSADI